VLPFDRHRAVLASPSDNRASQALGTVMRTAGIEAFEYVSARDPKAGTSVAVHAQGACQNGTRLAGSPAV